MSGAHLGVQLQLLAGEVVVIAIGVVIEQIHKPHDPRDGHNDGGPCPGGLLRDLEVAPARILLEVQVEQLVLNLQRLSHQLLVPRSRRLHRHAGPRTHRQAAPARHTPQTERARCHAREAAALPRAPSCTNSHLLVPSTLLLLRSSLRALKLWLREPVDFAASSLPQARESGPASEAASCSMSMMNLLKAFSAHPKCNPPRRNPCRSSVLSANRATVRVISRNQDAYKKYDPVLLATSHVTCARSLVLARRRNLDVSRRISCIAPRRPCHPC